MTAYDAIVNRHRTGRSVPGKTPRNWPYRRSRHRAQIGRGTCVNTGCTPTKTLVASAEVARIALRAAGFVVSIAGPVGIDMKRVKARKDPAVNVSGVLALGDCNRKGAFTHTAYDDLEIVAENLLDDDPRRVSHPTYATSCAPRRPMP